MRPGPAPETRPPGLSFLEKASAAWPEPLADWLVELARLADGCGLRGAEKRIGYSAGAISSVINNKYGKGDIGRVEETVRGALMALTVDCPELGELARDRCLAWQKKPTSSKV